MKIRSVLLSVISFLGLSVLTSAFASAYYFPSFRYFSESFIQQWIDILEPFLRAILGGYEWTSVLLFERLLVFVILVCLVFIALSKIPMFEERKPVLWIVSLIVPLIGVRFMDYAWLITIIIQYQVLAIALTAALPFFIYTIFLYNAAADYPVFRKFAWVLFIMVYLGLWASVDSSAHSEVYFWTMIVGVIALFADGTIYNVILRQKMRDANADDRWKYTIKLKKDIDDIQNSPLPADVKQRLIKKKQKEIKWIHKNT